MSHNISHGRGGAANIKPDDTIYTDGEIVREGPVGNQGDGPYSSGRGGAGNIDREGHASTSAGDDEFVPETATRPMKTEPQHFGRGGAGNLVKPAEKDKEHHESLKDKVKEALHIGKKE